MSVAKVRQVCPINYKGIPIQSNGTEGTNKTKLESKVMVGKRLKTAQKDNISIFIRFVVGVKGSVSVSMRCSINMVVRINKQIVYSVRNSDDIKEK